MLSINFDVSCLGSTQLTGIGNYAKNLIFQLGLIPDISMSGSYKISRWKKAEIISSNVPFTTFPYWPFISDWQNQNFDLYHGLDFFVPASRKFKKVVTVHDLAVYKSGLWNDQEAKTSIEGFEKVLFRNKPDHVITVSEFIKSEFLEKFPSFEGRVTAIYHGADHFTTSNSEPSLFSFPYIFFLGTVEIRKNVLSLVKAFELLARENTEIHLVLAGQTGYKSEEIKSHIEKSPFANRIIWNEKVSDLSVKNMMQHCTVFCYPSFYEGFGIPLVEAMSMGAPIVTSNIGAMKEIVGDAGLLFDPYGPPADLAEKLNQLVSDTSLQENLRNLSSKRKEIFTWKETALKTLDTYRSILK